MTENLDRKQRIIAFYDGMREGVALYAHWRDGTQYVGTTGKTLAKALTEIAEEEHTKLQELEKNGNTA